VQPVPFEKLSEDRRGELSKVIRERVTKAREIQTQRFADNENRTKIPVTISINPSTSFRASSAEFSALSIDSSRSFNAFKIGTHANFLRMYNTIPKIMSIHKNVPGFGVTKPIT
jgi:predicted ATPase with chaperone activity